MGLPNVANHYMEDVERWALFNFTGTAPGHRFRYVDDTSVKVRAREVGNIHRSNTCCGQ